MESLLSMYRSDEEEEEEDDREGDGNAGSAGRKRRRATASGPATAASAASALALPGLDDDFFAVSPNHVYTTVLTNGQRVVKPSAPTRFARAVPHIEGNWATHIYIRVPNTEEVLQLAHACIAHGQARLGARVLAEGEKEEDEHDGSKGSKASDEDQDQDQDQDGTPLIVPGDLKPAESGGAQHLSLSRTAYLRSHHIDPFVADLRKSLAWATSFTVGLDPAFGLLVNDERTRSFLTVGLGHGCEERLRRLVSSVDVVLTKYKQQTYYADPRFHVSVASLRGDVEGAWEKGGKGKEEGVGAVGDGAAVVVDTIECRVGHKRFTIGLREV